MTIPTKPSYSHGSTGTEPSTAGNYETGDPLDADEFDYYLNTVLIKINGLIDALEAIDSNDDEVVDAADGASTWQNGGSNVVDYPDEVNFGDKLNPSNPNSGEVKIDTTALDEEEVEDVVGNLITGGTGISVTYNDSTDTITISGHNKYTDNEARTAVDGSNVDITGNADTVDGYDIQKNGTDGSGIINFKT